MSDKYSIKKSKANVPVDLTGALLLTRSVEFDMEARVGGSCAEVSPLSSDPNCSMPALIRFSFSSNCCSFARV